jgi:hypothetical protein
VTNRFLRVDFSKARQGLYQTWDSGADGLLGQLFESLGREGFAMSYTIEDFKRDYVKSHFAKLTPKELREAMERLPAKHRLAFLETLPPEERLAGILPEERLAGLSEEEIRHYLEQLIADNSPQARKKKRIK